MAKLIFGCGYLGRRVAQRWLQSGHTVFAVTRWPSRAQGFISQGLSPIVCDLTEPSALGDLPAADSVLFAVGYDRTTDKTIRDVYVEGLRNVLDALPRDTGRILYISSTGVFGQVRGQWVDERSPCQPTREGGQACLEAERLLAAHPLASRAIILRMAGIYGPGRIPQIQQLQQGRAIAAPSRGYLNLVHVEDAASVVLAAEQRATPPRLYLVSDGCPVERADYYRELARLIGAPAPHFQDPGRDTPAALRAGSSKRICNQRMVDELAVKFVYPSYREGLSAIVAEQQSEP
jgi:nucleoside-diphosphate-sugar epimerase